MSQIPILLRISTLTRFFPVILLALLLASCAGMEEKPDAEEAEAAEEVTDLEEDVLGPPVEGTVRVRSTGSATVGARGTALARDAAVDDALRKAVEEAVGTMVSSDTVVENYSVLSDRVYTRSEGYVTEYAVVDEGMTGDLYTVTVEADVTKGPLRDDLQGLGLLMRRAEMPDVLFMVAEKRFDRGGYSYWWRESRAGEGSAAESAMKEYFLDKGFEVVDASNPPRPGLSAELTGSDARRVGAESGAEVVVYGTSRVTEGPRTPGSAVGVYLADVTAQAVRVDDGKVLASATGHGTARHISETTGADRAVRSATEELAARLATQIADRWAGPFMVRVVLRGVEGQERAAEFKELLISRVRGVDAVYQRRLGGGTAVFEVESGYSAQDMADDLAGLDLRDAELRVTGTTPDTVEVTAGPRP